MPAAREDGGADEEETIEATVGWVCKRCGVAENARELALPGHAAHYPKLRSLGSALLSFGNLTALDVSRNQLATFEGLASLAQLTRLNFYFNAVASLGQLELLQANRQLSNLDCRLNPLSRTHPEYRVHTLHTLPQLLRLDERDVRPSERRQANAYTPPVERGGPHTRLGADSEPVALNYWNSPARGRGATAGADPSSASSRHNTTAGYSPSSSAAPSFARSSRLGGEHDSASLQRAARALLQQDEDEDEDEEEDEEDVSTSEAETSSDFHSYLRSPDGQTSPSRSGVPGSPAYSGASSADAATAYGPRRGPRRGGGGGSDGGGRSSRRTRGRGGDGGGSQVRRGGEGAGGRRGLDPARVDARAIAQLEAEFREREARWEASEQASAARLAELGAELDTLREEGRRSALEAAHCQRELSEAHTAVAAAEAQREAEAAAAQRWQRRAQEVEEALAGAEAGRKAASAESRLAAGGAEAAEAEAERLRQQLATQAQLLEQLRHEAAEAQSEAAGCASEARGEVAAARANEVAAVAEAAELRKEIGTAERYLHDARGRIELLSSELVSAKEHGATAAATVAQTTAAVEMLQAAHGALIATNEQLRHELQAVHERYAADSARWQSNFSELANHYEGFGDIKEWTAELLKAGGVGGAPRSAAAAATVDSGSTASAATLATSTTTAPKPANPALKRTPPSSPSR